MYEGDAMSLHRKLLLALVVTFLLIINGGMGAPIQSKLIYDDNTTILSYTASDLFDEDSASDFDTSSTSLIYCTFASVPPTIDGLLSYGEWGEPAIVDTLSYSNDSINYETHDMYVYFMNDNNYLYIAVKITDDDFESDNDFCGSDLDVLEIYFDGDNNEIIEPGEDIKRFTNFYYSDWYYMGDGSWSTDETSDGEGVASHSNHALGDYTYEFKIPLNSGDAHDFAITPDSTIGLKIEYSEYYYDSSDESWICDGNSDGWPNNGDQFDAANHGKLKLSSSASSDTEIPDLTITSPVNGLTVTTSTIPVTGTATDNIGVTSLTVNSNSVTVESDGSFTTTISLTSGVNIITVVATDAAGNTATQSVTVTCTSTTIMGDLNRNGMLDTGDVTLALRMAVGLTTPDMLGDMNDNGIVDTGDATLMLRTIVGLE